MHVVLHEAGIATQLVKLDPWKHVTENGEDYRAIAPKAAVPALVLPDGELLTEGSAILQ